MEKQELHGHAFIDSFMFSGPHDMMIADSLLIIHDADRQEFPLHIFNKKTGEYIKSFGKTGIGPGELKISESAMYDKDSNSITLYDPNLRKIVSYSLNGILQKEAPLFEEVMLKNTPNFIRQCMRYQDMYFLQGNNDQMRFGILSHEDSLSVLWSQYPRLVTDKEENWAIWGYSSKWKLKPDASKMVITTYIGTAIEILNVNQPWKIDRSIVIPIHKPIYKLAQGAKPKWVTTDDETIIGIDKVFVTDHFIYVSIYGVPLNKMEKTFPKLLVFDWKGNPVVEYSFQERITAFAVDENNRVIYASIDDDSSVKQYKY